jgi:hypothetical protein
MVLYLASFLVAGMGVMQANQITGSLPLTGMNDSENGTNLMTSTSLWDLDTVTSGPGLGDFSVVPMLTDYGAFSLNLTTVGSGGGFTLSNATYGTFVASAGSIVFQNPSFLDAVVSGTYTPGPGLVGATAGPMNVEIVFAQNQGSVAAAMTFSSVPEPGTMMLFGSAMLGLTTLCRKRPM